MNKNVNDHRQRNACKQLSYHRPVNHRDQKRMQGIHEIRYGQWEGNFHTGKPCGRQSEPAKHGQALIKRPVDGRNVNAEEGKIYHDSKCEHRAYYCKGASVIFLAFDGARCVHTKMSAEEINGKIAYEALKPRYVKAITLNEGREKQGAHENHSERNKGGRGAFLEQDDHERQARKKKKGEYVPKRRIKRRQGESENYPFQAKRRIALVNSVDYIIYKVECVPNEKRHAKGQKTAQKLAAQVLISVYTAIKRESGKHKERSQRKYSKRAVKIIKDSKKS